MVYRELLKKLTKFGYGQVSRMTRGSYDMASIGKPSEVVYPWAFRSYPVILEDDLDSVIDEEIIEGLLRWADIDKAEFDGPVI
jgi:hypothetical protein